MIKILCTYLCALTTLTHDFSGGNYLETSTQRKESHCLSKRNEKSLSCLNKKSSMKSHCLKTNSQKERKINTLRNKANPLAQNNEAQLQNNLRFG